MRQAGRSLPEYRAARGTGSILEAIAQPELAAELTRQPVDRYGTDAAILFSDIVVPVAAIGFGVEVAPGTGPVVDRPFRTKEDLHRLRPFEPPLDAPYVGETVAQLAAELAVPLIGFAGGPFTVASYLVEGRSVADLRHRQVADVHRAGAVARAHGPARRHRRGLAAVPARRRGRRRAGVRLVGRSARPPPLPAVRAARHPPGLRRAGRHPPGRALHPLRGGHRRAPAGDGRGRQHGGGRGLAGARSTRPGGGSDPASPSRATSTPPCAWPRGPWSKRRHAPCSSRPATSPATSSTWATACSPRPTRRSSSGWSSSCTPRAGPECAGEPTPPRPPACWSWPTARRHRPARSRPSTRPSAAAQPPPPELLAELEDRYRAIGGLSPLTEITRSQVAGLAAELEARAPGRYVVAYGAKHVRPSIEEGAAELVEAGVGRVVGIVLTPHESSLGSGSYLERAEAALTATSPASGPPVAFVAVRSWHRTEGFCRPAGRTHGALARLAGAVGATQGGSVLHRPQRPPTGPGQERSLSPPGGRVGHRCRRPSRARRCRED